MKSFKKNQKGRKEKSFNQEVTADIQKVLDYINKGFYLVEGNTAIEHKEGGYISVSKRVTNYFSK